MLAEELIVENIWDSERNLVLFKEFNGTTQRISIETINGQKVRGSIDKDSRKEVEELFPNGLPAGMHVVFISRADNKED